jgi:hypothetical protein
MLKSRTSGERIKSRSLRLQQLDPQKDYLEISQLFFADFRSVLVALPFAGFMTAIAAPRMSRILSKRGEIESHFTKRGVDTSLFASILIGQCFGAEQGREAAQRVNNMHGQYDIHQDDFLLVGCDAPLFALDMAERYGWRPVTDIERKGLRVFFSHQARAFGSRRPLPDTIAQMRQLVSDYFDTQLDFEPQNKKMAKAALHWHTRQAPKPLRPLFRIILLSVIDPRVVRACGLAVPGKAFRLVANAAMKLMGRRDPIPDGEGLDEMADLARLAYPNGYDLGVLGPVRPAGRARETTVTEAVASPV